MCHDVVYTEDTRYRRETPAGAVGPGPIVAVSWRSTKGERAAGAVRQQLARLCPRDPLVGRLPAHARLPGDGGHALAGADELDEPLSPAGREP